VKVLWCNGCGSLVLEKDLIPVDFGDGERKSCPECKEPLEGPYVPVYVSIAEEGGE